MNRTIAQATLSAAAFAGLATLWVLWMGSRRRQDRHASHEMRKQLKTWEEEGGNLAPPATVDASAAH